MGEWGSPLPWNYSAPGTLLEPLCNYTVSVLCFGGFITLADSLGNCMGIELSFALISAEEGDHVHGCGVVVA